MTVLRQELTENLAIKVKIVYDPGTGHIKITRAWDKIDASVSKTIAHAVSTTVTDPKADNNTYTGIYYVSNVIEEAQSDRAVRITEELTSNDTYDFSIVSLLNCHVTGTTWYYFGVTIDNLPDISDAAAWPRPAGTTYDLGPLYKNENGTYNTFVTRRVVIDQEGDGATESAAESTDIETHTEKAAEETAEETDGSIISVANAPTDACLWRTRKETRTPKDQTGSAERRSAAIDSDITATHTEGDAVSEEDKTLATGEIKDIGEAPTPAGNVRTSVRTIKPKDQEGGGASESAAETSTTVTHTEKATEETVTETTGSIVSASNNPTEADNYRTSKETRTPKDQTATSERHSSAEDTVRSLHTEGETVADKSADSGTIRDVGETPTQAGNVRTVDSVTTPQDQTSTIAQVSNPDSLTTHKLTTHTQKSSQESITDTDKGLLASGKHNLVQIWDTLTEVGKHATQKLIKKFAYKLIGRSYTTRYGTATYIKGKHATVAQTNAAAAALDATTNNSMSSDSDEAGGENYSIKRTPYKGGSGAVDNWGNGNTDSYGWWEQTSSKKFTGEWVFCNILWTDNEHRKDHWLVGEDSNGVSFIGTGVLKRKIIAGDKGHITEATKIGHNFNGTPRWRVMLITKNP